ncbi:hypothetical protein [Mesorhizobium sp. M0217]|uniref:hypothetical protein n=1 Tax=unclassified Mesorhizobium TaxID=325217 RepID=UPI00333687DD
MKGVARVFAIAGVVLVGGYPCNAAPLDTMAEVVDAIQACWTPPAGAGNASVTLSFSFKRDGTLIGPPRPTAIKVDGDADTRKSFVDAATTALQKCLPLSFSPTLAQASRAMSSPCNSLRPSSRRAGERFTVSQTATPSLVVLTQFPGESATRFSRKNDSHFPEVALISCAGV